MRLFSLYQIARVVKRRETMASPHVSKPPGRNRFAITIEARPSAAVT
jgi:hypothetical protein